MHTPPDSQVLFILDPARIESSSGEPTTCGDRQELGGERSLRSQALVEVMAIRVFSIPKQIADAWNSRFHLAENGPFQSSDQIEMFRDGIK